MRTKLTFYKVFLTSGVDNGQKRNLHMLLNRHRSDLNDMSSVKIKYEVIKI